MPRPLACRCSPAAAPRRACLPPTGRSPRRCCSHCASGARPRAALRPYLPAIARFVPHWRAVAGVSASESPAVIGESVIRVLSWLAGGKGLVLVLEDMHWADAETLAVCDYLADHVAAAPVSVLCVARTAEGPGALAAIGYRAAAVALTPLDAGQVIEMATACLGRVPEPAATAWLLDSAAGLPLLVEDLLDEDQAGPVRFDRLVHQRMAKLPADQRRVVMAAALLGADIDAGRLSAVCGVPLAAVREAVESAARAQLLTRGSTGAVAFRHALTRDAVLAGSPAERAAAVASAAAVLDGDADPLAAARAAELWAEPGEQDRASRAWERAATAAGAAGAPASALSAWRQG